MKREATTLPALLNDRTRREREENDNPWLGEALREENERPRTLARCVQIFAHPAAKKIPSGQEEEGDRSGWTMPNWLVEEKEKRAEKRAKEKEAKEKDAKLSTARNHTLSFTGVLYTGRLRAKLPPSALLPMPDNLAEVEHGEQKESRNARKEGEMQGGPTDGGGGAGDTQRKRRLSRLAMSALTEQQKQERKLLQNREASRNRYSRSVGGNVKRKANKEFMSSLSVEDLQKRKALQARAASARSYKKRQLIAQHNGP